MDDPLFDLDVEHDEPVRFLELAAAREPDARRSSTRRPARSSASRATCRSTRTTRSRRSTSTASRKYATEQLHLLYHDVYGLRATAVRLTNVFGPRQRLRDDLQGFLPIFVRRALADEPITVFGDGAQQRDCLYVDDVVECLLLAATTPRGAAARSSTSATTSTSRCARSPTRSSPAPARAGSSTCRGPPIATPSTSARTSATRRRRSGCSAGSRAPRSPTASRARSRSSGPGRAVVPVTRRRLTPVPVRRPRPPGRGARARALRGGRPRRAVGRLPARPRARARSKREFAAFTGRRHAVGVASGTDALRLVAGRARRWSRATR